MLYEIQQACQQANPHVIESLTKAHGVYVNVYDKAEATEYDEGRDIYASNSGKYNVSPKYVHIQLLLNRPIQETYDSGRESFDDYMEDLFFITCKKDLVFNKGQKFEVFYNKCMKKPQRVFQCFEVRSFSSTVDSCSVRHIMLKPFN